MRPLPFKMQRRLKIRLIQGIVLLALIFGGGIGMLYAVREVEKRDAFCGSCHMDDHHLKLRQSLASEATTLSAYHRIQDKVRCIDCHGYDSLSGRVETMTLATKSLLQYITGNFEDPSRTTEPIRDESCVKCHSFRRAHPSGEDEFHGRLPHIDLPTPCVDCHRGHELGAPAHAYLVRSRVLEQCVECHPERGG
jgi:nitrate/TMAO reductase-like tetraheme cytochrome c subunit